MNKNLLIFCQFLLKEKIVYEMSEKLSVPEKME